MEELVREFCSGRTCGRILTEEELVGEFCSGRTCGRILTEEELVREFCSGRTCGRILTVEELVREFCSGRTCGRILTEEELVGEFCTNLYNFRRTAFACAILIFSASRIRNHENLPDFLLKMSQTPIKIHLCQRKNLWKYFWGGRTCGRIFEVEELVEEFLGWKNLWKNFAVEELVEEFCRGRILRWENFGNHHIGNNIFADKNSADWNVEPNC